MNINEAAVWIKNLFSPDPEANFPEKMEAIGKMLESETTASVLTKHDLIRTAQWLSEYIQKRTRTGDRIPQECVTCIHEQVCEMVWDEKGGTCSFWKPVAENTTTDTSTDRSTGKECPEECRDCTHCETCGRVFENKGGPCPYREQGKNEPTATAQDILNLATAYAVIQRNKSLGGGYELSKVYRGGILNALEKTTGKYCEQFAENKGGQPTNEKAGCFEAGGTF